MIRVTPRWKIFWTSAPWLVDRMPWFVRRPAMNLLFGRELYWEFNQSERVARNEWPLNNLACVKW